MKPTESSPAGRWCRVRDVVWKWLENHEKRLKMSQIGPKNTSKKWFIRKANSLLLLHFAEELFPTAALTEPVSMETESERFQKVVFSVSPSRTNIRSLVFPWRRASWWRGPDVSKVCVCYVPVLGQSKDMSLSFGHNSLFHWNHLNFIYSFVYLTS